GSGAGAAFFVDTRKPTDPVTLAALPVIGEPFGATIAGGRAYVVSGRHVGTKNGPKCTPFPAQIPDSYAQSHGVRPPSKSSPASGSLAIYSSAGADAQIVSSLQFSGLDLTDVVVVRDVAVLASYDSGLIFVDVADATSPKELLRIPFDRTMSN